MGQYDVHRLKGGRGLVIDCQADLLAHLSIRFVVPLLSAKEAPETDKRLRPRFTIDGETLVMATPLASSIPKDELGPKVGTLAQDYLRVVDAIDTPISGI